ncbi:glycosyltransferase WbuB [Macrococcoides caseolyticum]|uniref:glycosyltransferase family 4 protein n=1 Tax=Macrococcoides caseolyticum TaxID=69966 RepID=UPI000C332D6C|nr:glycosyltransferase family 4 protein [Macrococcus caseolyticus]PKE65095.1 glycosyltransferase WbuB [Macrococcus caseolyticus]
MKILFITLLDLEDLNQKGIYHDFVNELISRGNEVTVVCPSEKRFDGKTKIYNSKEATVLKVKVGNITKTTKIVKGINILRIERAYKKAINNYLENKKFELIVYSTPPITFNNLISYLKKKHNAKTYLLLKDIFPQNAVDLKILKKTSLVYWMFRIKEKKLYKVSDYIGAMSPQNVKYIKTHNKINSDTHIFRNAIYRESHNVDINVIKEKFKLNHHKKLLLYGGNIGLPQGIAYIKKIIDRFNEIENAQLVIVGNGTHYKELENHINTSTNPDIKIFNYMPKDEYNDLLIACDVGLIFLDSRFTIPNYPSRLTDFLAAGKPILCATDKNTDLKDEIISYEVGYWNESNNVDDFINNANELLTNDMRQYKVNATYFYNKVFKIEDNVDNFFNLIHK